MKRFIALALFVMPLLSPAGAAEPKDARVPDPRVTEHRGIGLMYQPADPNKKFDTSLLPAKQGLRNITKAIDQLLDRSPISAQKIESLKKSGRVLLVYLPDDLRDNAAGGESVALFLPDFLRKTVEPEQKKTFLVVVGRHGVKWPANELAAVLAHELVGHGVQHQRGRLSDIRDLDAECEAYLYEEIANQNLGLDKRSREMVAFRQGMEDNFCSDFKTFMRKSRSSDMALWDVLNPDVPKLLSIFEAYLDHSKSKGVTGKSLAAKKQLLQERRNRVLKDASADQIYKFAVQLRDGDFGVAADSTEALRYFKRAAERGHAAAHIDLGWIYTKGTGVKKDPVKAFAWFHKAAEQGRADAQSRLGWLYMKGRGVTKDHAAAYKWFTKAATKKYALAYYNLGTMHQLGLGRARDAAGAAKWYRKGAESGHAASQNQIGWLTANGTGVSKDKIEACKWYTLAAAKGSKRARSNLAALTKTMAPADISKAKQRAQKYSTK